MQSTASQSDSGTCVPTGSTPNVAYGYDGSGQFGVSGTSLANKTYNATISFDPTALMNDTCGVSANNSCQWNFGGTGVSETITINSIIKTYALTSGTIQFCACGNDSVYIAASSGGLQFGLNFSDTNLLFSNQLYANNPKLMLDFTNLSATNANFQTSGLAETPVSAPCPPPSAPT